MRKFAYAMIILITAIFLVSCQEETDPKPTPGDVSIYFNTKMNDVSVESLTGKPGDVVTKPIDPVKEGHVFLYWRLNGLEYTFSVFPEETIILEAVWQQDAQFLLILDTDSQQTIPQGKYYAGDRIFLPNLDYKVNETNTEVYQFVGWFDGDDRVNYTEMPANDLYLIAKWEKVVAIIFDTGNANQKIAPIIVEPGKTIVAPQVELQMGEFFFAGWQHNTRPYIFDKMPEESITLVPTFISLLDEKPDEIVMPKMFVDLENHYSLGNVNREDYIMASFTILNPDSEFDIFAITGEFRGRGHGSWDNFAKKGYKLKFDKKQGLFGLAANKHWVIVAGGHDPSLLRHNMAYTLGLEVFDYINYQTSVIELEVYINGAYHGVYALYEHIRVAEGRVDINSEFGVLDTAYLIEYDAYARADGIVSFDIAGLKYPFTIKGPKMEDWQEDFEGGSEALVRAQTTWIKNYVQTVVTAALNKDELTFKANADVNSFVDIYLLHEYMKNTDTGWSSLFFYKEAGGKLKAGPAWDFDLSSGTNRGNQSPSGFFVSGKGSGTAYADSNHTSSELFIALMEQEWFVRLVAQRFLVLADRIEASVTNYFNKVANFEDAYIRDAIRWNSGSGAWKTNQANLQAWLYNRIDWLETWANDYLN